MLSKLKQVDLYRKVSGDHTTQTVRGGILSVFSYLLILYLFLSEFSCYVNSPYTPKLIVEASTSSRIRLDVNLTLHHMPCGLLAMAYTDMSSQHYTRAYLKKYPIERGQVIWEDSAPASSSRAQDLTSNCGPCYGAELYEGQCCNTCEEVMEAYTSRNWKAPRTDSIEQCKDKDDSDGTFRGEGCLVFGNIMTRKIPASVRIELDAMGRTIMSRMGLIFDAEHTVNHIGFSDPDGEVLQGPRDGRRVTGNYLSLYYLKVTPAVKDQVRFYETSDTHLGIAELTYPLVAINYDIEPITTVYERNTSFTEFIISICAIIGGWFSVSMILSKFIIK